MEPIRTPRCPGCDQLPVIMMNPHQVFCGNADCKVFCWDMTDAVSTFWATAVEVDTTMRPHDQS